VLRQLTDANLDDDDEVVRILEEYGALTWAYFDRAYVPRERHPYLSADPTIEELRDRTWWERREDATLEDARWWLKTARALARTWSYVERDRDPVSVWDEEGFVEINEADLWAQFTLALDAGLRPFRARATFRQTYPGGYGNTFGAPVVGLYSAACRQVFNLIVNKETAHECDKCGRIFVHQLGGAVEGRYRSIGVIYCTPKCARAEASRKYRRRESAKKKGNT
jgi:hypothetical protein